MHKFSILLSLLLISSIAFAQPVVIDFESGTSNAPISEDGFTLTADGPNAVFSPSPTVKSSTKIVFEPSGGFGSVTNGTNIFGWCANTCGSGNIGVKGIGVKGTGDVQTINLSHDNAELFSLVSIDSTNLSGGSIQVGQTIDIVGNLSTGGTVSQSFTLVPETYTTFFLNPSFNNLVSIDITSNPTSCVNGICDIGIDNISVVLGASATSIPTMSSWGFIFMLMIIGLLTVRHIRRTVA